MASSNSVRILEVIRVSPTFDSADSPIHLSPPLTFFDVLWLKLPPTERVFFYQLTGSTLASFDSVILPKLKRSLSLTLFHYFPLAGRLTWDSQDPKPSMVNDPNDAVTVTIAESGADFSRLSSQGTIEAVELHPLVPELPASDSVASIIALQITLFHGHGFCIGFAAHHAILDGQSATMFLKAWAYICRQDQETPSLPSELIPSFDRSQIKDPAGLEKSFLNSWLAFDGADSDPSERSLKPFRSLIGPDVVRATFELTRGDIKKLRERVMENELIKQHPKPLHLSSFVLAYAYCFTCMVKARGGDDTRTACFGFAADYRTRLEPALPPNYFGNCVGPNFCFATAGDFIGKNGLAFAAKELSNLVSESSKALARAQETVSKLMRKEPGKQIGSIAGSPRFGFYGLDFGWGKPWKVEIVSIDRTGAFGLTDSKDESGGIEVGLALKRDEMEIFASLFANGFKDL